MCVCAYVYVCECMCVCLCMCVCEGERERVRVRERKRERERFTSHTKTLPLCVHRIRTHSAHVRNMYGTRSAHVRNTLCAYMCVHTLFCKIRYVSAGLFCNVDPCWSLSHTHQNAFCINASPTSEHILFSQTCTHQNLFCMHWNIKCLHTYTHQKSFCMYMCLSSEHILFPAHAWQTSLNE